MAGKAVRLGAAAALLAVAALFGAACNYTEGQCFPREEIEGPGSDGAGGSVIVPGWGGYGEAPPPEPQDADDPEPEINCNKTEQPDQAGSCGDSGVATLAGTETYAYCSGTCAAKCPPGGVNGFSPLVFKFMTQIPDDGQGPAGGWQVATATLNFYRWTGLLPESWSCTITVGMPLRTAVNGKITAPAAATITAVVASQASFTVMRITPELPPGVYCFRFKEEMKNLFKNPPFDTYGARMP